MENDFRAAADEYLAACKEFEMDGDLRSLRKAQINTATVVIQCERFDDAYMLAIQAIADLEQEPSLPGQLRPILDAIIDAVKSHKNG